MTMKRILHCALILSVLTTGGCGFFGDDSTTTPNANSSPTSLPKNNIEFNGAAGDVRSAYRQLSSLPETATVKPVKDPINRALGRLGEEDQLRVRCTDCTDQTKDEASEVLRGLTGILVKLGPDSTKVSALKDDLKESLQDDLDKQAKALTRLNDAKPRVIEPASPSPSIAKVDVKNDGSGEPAWWSIFIFPLQIVAGLVGLLLLLSAIIFVWKQAWKRLEINVARVVRAHVAAERDGQPDYTAKFSSLSLTQSEMNTKLTELDSEVRSLARFVRESLARRPERSPSYSGSNHQSSLDDVSLKDEPEFPVSAVDYLGKMNRFATVVRPDFQNGILVNDPDGTGELVLIRDSRLSDATQPLFVVPSLTQFHTKQDFYTYYEKYYECVRPSGGNVWILGPAIVEKVTGGWQLREKGMLEIR